MSNQTWTVGEEVAVETGGASNDVKLHTIVKVNKQFVVLDDNTKWNLDGELRGGSNSWHRSTMCKLTPALREQAARCFYYRKAHRLIDSLEAKCKSLNGAQLKGVCDTLQALIGEERKEQET